MAKPKMGRPIKYILKDFKDKVDAYIEMKTVGSSKGPMTVLDFCCFAGIYKDYISEHNLKDGSPQDFSEPIKRLKTECENCLEYYSLAGKLNPTMAIFSLKNNFGWKDSFDTTTKIIQEPLDAQKQEILDEFLSTRER